MKKIIAVVILALSVLSGCSTEADTASYNTSKAADNFQVERRIIFFNGTTDKYLLSIEGLCSVEVDASDAQLEVVCRLGKNSYKKHYLGLSDNVTYFIEQLRPARVSGYHYRVMFRPETIVPDVDFKTNKNGKVDE